MKKQPTNRKYNFPDADLYQYCMDSIKNATRDLKIFQQYGFDTDRLKGFQAKCKQFIGLPNDDELLGDQMIATDKKYTASEKLKSAIRSVMARVAVKYNNRTGRYRKFGTAKLGDMTDAQLLFCGRRVIRVARQQIDFLADVGINENLLKRVSDTASSFERALNIQQDKLADRDIGVERRTELGNKLYDELIMVCNIGKDIWAETDITKYEQYTVYESNNEQKKARKLAETSDKTKS